jgi:hypothetical protein
MIRPLLLALIALCLPAIALAQPRDSAAGRELRDAAPGLWTRADGRLRFVAGRISVPDRAAALTLTRATGSANYPAGLDNAALYESADGQVRATVYIYAPNLAHAGLGAYATDTFMRAHPRLSPRRLGSRLTGAGGQDGAAIRIDYANYLGDHASIAAFLKVDRWIVKLRVTGPEARRAEVEAAMTAFLDGIRLENGQRARPPEPLDPRACPAAASRAAALLPSTTEDTAEEGMIGTVEHDGQARESDGAGLLTPRFGTAWCLSRMASSGEVRLPILRSLMPGDGRRQRSVLVVLLSDSGRMLEVVDTRRRGRFVVFIHRIGRSELRGAYDGIPTDDQILEILTGNDRPRSPVRAIVERVANGNATVTINRPAAPES